MKLYEITEQYQHAMVELDNSDFDADTIADTLEGLKGDLEAKSRAVAGFIANREAEIAATKEAAKKLSDRAKAEQGKMDKLREYLLYNMQRNEISEIRSPDLLLNLKKNPPSCIIDDESLIPEKYKKEVVTTTIKIDKNAIKSDLKEGKVDGAHLEAKERLEIK